MLAITRKLARRLRSVFRRGRASPETPVVFRPVPAGIDIECRVGNVGLRFHHPGDFQGVAFAVPLNALTECEGGRDEAVVVRPGLETVAFEWQDAGVPQRRVFPRLDPDETPALSMPAAMSPAGDGPVVSMLTEVQSCAARDRTRYAIDGVLLRGRCGDAVATDGKQMLLVGGFRFPWTEELIVLGLGVLAARELADAGPVDIGRSDDHVVLRTGPWTVWLPIEKNGRFPDIDRIVPNANQGPTQATLTSEDLAFLVRSLPRLPGKPDDPVTLDIGSDVRVRASTLDGPPTELVLSGSQVRGRAIRIGVAREYLLCAAHLGFTEYRFWSDQQPLLAYDRDRSYLWQPITGSAIDSTPDAIQIASTSSPPAKTQPHRRIIAVNPQPSPLPRPPEPDAEDSTVDPLESAEALRTKLRETLGLVGQLVLALKRQRRQSQLVRSTLASLRQLRDVA